MKLIVIVFLVGIVGCNQIPGSTDNVLTSEEQVIIDEFETSLEGDLRKDSTGGSISVAIVRANRVIYSKAFGYADKTTQQLADISTIYRAGSISKSFTAFLMMKLVDKGVIKLNDPVDLYLPEVKGLQGYSDSTKFTFKQLASHTSGLAREPMLENANVGLINGWEDKLLSSIPTTHFDSRPGTRFSYSNIGFGILGLALSRAAKQPFMSLVQENIFDPLKMTRSFYMVPDKLKDEVALGMNGGTCETVDINSPKKEHTGRGYKVPNGGIYSTPNDLAKFMIDNLGPSTILSKESLDAMQTEQGPDPNRYGFGFMVFHNDEVSIVGHNGQVLGYTAQFAFEKESRYGVILMRNYTCGSTDLDKSSLVLLGKLKQLKKR